MQENEKFHFSCICAHVHLFSLLLCLHFATCILCEQAFSNSELHCLSGVRTPNKFANLDISKFITYHASWWRVFNSGTHRERLDAAILKMKKQLELQSWLESESLGHLYPQFVSHGFVSKNDITERLDRDTLMSITGEEFWNVVEAVNALISGDRQDKLPKIKSDVSLSVTAPLLAGVKVILWLILLLGKF